MLFSKRAEGMRLLDEYSLDEYSLGVLVAVQEAWRRATR